MELVRIFKEHNVFGWISVGTAILSLAAFERGNHQQCDFLFLSDVAVCDGRRAVRHH